MTLTQIFLLLGVVHAVAGLWLGLSPEKAGDWLRRFPRQVAPGVFLMLLGTGWFVANLYRSDVTDFKEWQHLLLAGFTLLGVGCCFFVQDYLSIRGGGVVALLVCDYFLDVRRPSDNPWSVILSVWCYVVIVCSVWWVGSPWRVRDLVGWMTAEKGRLANVGYGLVGTGAILAGLGVSVLR